MNLAYDYLMLARIHLDRGAPAEARVATDHVVRLLPELTPGDRAALTPHVEEIRDRLGRP